MTTNDDRNMNTFIEECLELLEPISTASAADLGMAYRAWIDDADLTDEEVVAQIVAARPNEDFEIVKWGGSSWLRGAQISDIGRDMVNEGGVMHLEIAERAAGAARSG